MSDEDVLCRIDQIVSKGDARRSAASDVMRALLPFSDSWLTTEEMCELHSLRLRAVAFLKSSNSMEAARERVRQKRLVRLGSPCI